jgi:hypothetical protein
MEMNINIKNFLFMILLLASATLVRAVGNEEHEAKILLRVHSVKEAEAATGYPIHLEEEGLIDVLKKLRPDDEVLLKGEILYHPVMKDNRTEMNPTFHVHEIKPVSLSRLGLKDPVVVESKQEFTPQERLGKNNISIPDGVSESLVLTGSILLIQSSAQAMDSSSPTQNLNQKVLFSAAALATGYMLWQQITKK